MTKSGPPQAWEQELESRLALLGHRNWIVVADAAYPAHSNAGIETIVTDTDQIRAVRTVLKKVAACGHVRARVYTDAELNFVEDRDAPGMRAYRRRLKAALLGADTQSLPHEQILARMDQCADLYRILVLKTNLLLPYTSVFVELDCGYWNANAEQRLRKAMMKSQ